MSDKITDIEDFIRDTTINNYMNKSGNTLHDVARYIYTAHVKPLEDALAKAEADKAELVEALEHIVIPKEPKP